MMLWLYPELTLKKDVKMSVKKFRKKPVEIEAIRLESNASSIKKVLEFMGQEVNTKGLIASDKFYNYCASSYKYGGIDIKTLEGKHKASFLDMIIKGVNGEFYPCKPDIFEATYSIGIDEEGLMKTFREMCQESLDPETYKKSEDVEKVLRETRNRLRQPADSGRDALEGTQTKML